MVDEVKAFNVVSELVTEVRALRQAVTKLTQENARLAHRISRYEREGE